MRKALPGKGKKPTLVVALCAVVVTAVSVGSAFAGEVNGNGDPTKVPANANSTTPFKFTDAGISCTGVHILTTGRNPVHKESITCIDTVGYFAPGTYSTGWFSDYHVFILHEPRPVDPADPNVAISATIVVTDNGNGTFTWNVVSYYPVSS